MPEIQPLAVFAAGRSGFDVIVRVAGYPNAIKAAIFDELHLERYGWDFKSARLTKQPSTDRGEAVYRLERG